MTEFSVLGKMVLWICLLFYLIVLWILVESNKNSRWTFRNSHPFLGNPLSKKKLLNDLVVIDTKNRKMQFFKFIFLLFHICVAIKEPQVNRSVSPEFLPYEAYKIGKLWTQALNLQTCSIVQIGDNFCALFLEASEGKSYQEYFLGICQCETLVKWKLCSPELTETRKEDCEFQRNRKLKVSKVHRRFCDLKRISEMLNATCDCSQKLFGKQMLNVVGFPTCYLPSQSKSVCETLDVCGVSNCRSEVLTGGVVRVNCNSKCPGKQPVGRRSESKKKTNNFHIFLVVLWVSATVQISRARESEIWMGKLVLSQMQCLLWNRKVGVIFKMCWYSHEKRSFRLPRSRHQMVRD